MADGTRDEGVRYTAFLSYSHQDATAARRLHRRLESYRIPRRLVGAGTARGPVPARLWPIFRDREELPAASDLSETVRAALAQSGALIILCSPAAAGSLWVAEEIEVFRNLHPDRPILAAILDGDPPDCFPQALRAFGRDGTWHEPLATDLRRDGDGSRLGLLKLVAGITGVGLDALVQRDAARRIRRVMAVTAAALVAMLIMAALAVVALQARREADRQRAEAEGLVEFMLTDLRFRLTGVGRLDIMYAVNGRALQYYEIQRELYGRPSDSARLARVKLALGEVELARGDQRGAIATFREAYRLTTSLIERSPADPEVVFAHAQGEYWIGYTDYLRGDRDATRRAWTRYKVLAEQLLALDGNNPRWLREAGYADGNLCSLALMPPVDSASAQDLCSVALARMAEAHRIRPADPQITQDLANRHSWMVDAMSANGRWEQAMFHITQHEALIGSLIRRDPANIDYRDISMQSQFGFGERLAARGEHAKARQRFEAAARTAAVLIARDPENAIWQNWQRRIATRL